MKAKKIGVCAVDAGLLMIGDPCYFIGKDSGAYKQFKSWDDFLKRTKCYEGRQLNFEHGGSGLGVVARTKYGDGEYPVYEVVDANGGHALVVVTAGNPLSIPGCDV